MHREALVGSPLVSSRGGFSLALCGDCVSRDVTSGRSWVQEVGAGTGAAAGGGTALAAPSRPFPRRLGPRGADVEGCDTEGHGAGAVGALR